uniref:MAP7 domain-containing protein n=1 Tax=Arion vulgaris TaxID=1028688 RepID=A0A0B7BCU5_9EUPU
MDKDDDGAPSSSPQSSPVHHKEQHKSDNAEGRDSIVSFDSSAEPMPRKSQGKPKSAITSPQTPSQGQDLTMVDMKTSWDGSATSGGSAKAGMLADPVKIAKEREKEERVRQARERLKEERKKKLEELKEQQRIAQENRDKQLEMRRRRIEDLRKRDFQRRAAVEERRKMKEDVEKARRESILQRAEERVARFEAWKAGGRKGGRGHILGFGSATPRDICQPFERPRRSSSHSALQRRSPNGSEIDSMRPQRRALSACSAVRRHCYVYNNRIGTTTSTPAISLSTQHNQRPQNGSVMTTSLNRASLTASMPSPVKLRENKPPRKQRPASVASSMPSFVGGEPAKSPRSKSTDRSSRDRSKVRPPRRDEKALKDKENLTEKTQNPDHMEENEKEMDGDKDGARDRSHKKEKKERVSLSFFDRLSTPKFSKRDSDHTPKETPPKKEGPMIRVQFADDDDDGDQDGVVESERSNIREKHSPPHTKDSVSKHGPAKDGHRVTTSVTAGRSVSPSRKEVEKHSTGMSTPGQKGGDKSSTTSSRITPPPSTTSTPTHAPAGHAPSSAAAVTNTSNIPSQMTSSFADDGTTASRGAGGPAQDITAEEYKTRLAEKRRQAREKAEKEAEEERRRQEEARLAEEEQQRKEEEEDRISEEEALHFAQKAQLAEKERLERAIEAEEKRKREEAEKHEQDKKLKEEADKKAKEETERLEKEKQERAKREDEERLQRKKKLEMIMKRVKVDVTPEVSLKTESPTKSLSNSPNISQFNSSQNSPEEHEKPVASSDTSDEEEHGPTVGEGSTIETYSASMTTSFMQDLEDTSLTASTSFPTPATARSVSPGDSLDGQGTGNEAAHDLEVRRMSGVTTPSKLEEKMLPESSTEAKSKFKSPLLQHLVDNQGGNSPSSGPKFKSPLLQNLLGKTKVGARIGLSSSTGDLYNKDSSPSLSNVSNVMNTSMTASVSSTGNGSTFKEIFKQGKDDEDKDEDTSVRESFENYAVTNGIGKGSGDAHFPTSASKSSLDSSLLDTSKLPVSMMSDSALGSSIEPHGEGMLSQSVVSNGHGDHKSKDMEDSSISLYSINDGVISSATVIGTLPESQVHEGTLLPSHDDDQLEEYIDLIDSNGKSNSRVSGLPIIAFEENNRRSDGTEYMS